MLTPQIMSKILFCFFSFCIIVKFPTGIISMRNIFLKTQNDKEKCDDYSMRLSVFVMTSRYLKFMRHSDNSLRFLLGSE